MQDPAKTPVHAILRVIQLAVQLDDETNALGHVAVVILHNFVDS